MNLPFGLHEPLGWVGATVFAVSVALWKPARERARLRAAWGFLAVWIAVWCSTLLPAAWFPSPELANRVALALLQLAAIQVGAVLVFDFLLRRAEPPKFASEILIVAGYFAVIFNLLYKLGVNVTGIFATSAVAAAVLGFALQDMLSNIAGGVALELEGGIQPGDFVQCGEYAGWVQHVRLRHTAILTRDNDTVILPNSHLTRSSVRIHGAAHRHFVPLSMPYVFNPREVIDAVELALRASALQDVASDPAPRCVVQEMTPGFVRYAAVVWLTNPNDAFAISDLNVRVYFALQRAGIHAAEITNVLEMKAGGPALSERMNPVEVLRRTPILRLLEDADVFELGAHLHHLSFAPGEHIIRQGDAGDSMYFISAGQVSILFRSPDGMERRISLMESGDFFGEGSLLTGQARSASAVALSRVDCYRLDKEALQRIVSRRPELAEDMSAVMAHRQMELSTVRELLDLETARLREAENQTQLLARIRRFFGVE